MSKTNKLICELSPEEKHAVLCERISTYLQYRKDAEENKEYIDNVKELIKDTLEDIKNPLVNRVYKLNLEKESRFEVEVEMRDPVERALYYDPLEASKAEPNITREVWDRAIGSHQKYFDDEYERLKTWYSEKTKEKIGNDWIPLDKNSEPQRAELILDEEIISMAKGFMVGPVGLYNGKAVPAETHRYDNLEEMKIFLKVQAKTQDMVLYMAYKRDNMYWFRGTFVPVV